MIVSQRSILSSCLSLTLGFAGLVGCGDSSDPDLLGSEDLKPPGNLMIKDKGNGSIVLMWDTTNPEDDFEGYNIYGAKFTSLPTGVKTGEPLKLLDDAGEPVSATKTALDAFSYDNKNPNVLGSSAPAPVAIDDAVFAALPLHSALDSDGKPVLPTCYPESGTCKNTTATTELDSDKITSYGTVTYEMSGLTVGQMYCFLIFSVVDGGTGVSQSSSNVECVKPRHLISTSSATMPTSGFAGHYLDLRTMLTTCATKCDSALTLADTAARTSPAIDSATTTSPLSIESYSDDATNVFIATGQNAFIRPMGYFANGFSDTLPSVPTPSGFSDSSNPDYGGGYSREGQSVLLQPGYMYVIAVGDAARTNTSSYNFHWLWVEASNATIVRGTKFTFQLMLSSHTGN